MFSDGVGSISVIPPSPYGKPPPLWAVSTGNEYSSIYVENSGVQYLSHPVGDAHEATLEAV